MKEAMFEILVRKLESGDPKFVAGYPLTKEQYEIVEGIIEKKIAVWQDLLTLYSTTVINNELAEMIDG